MDTTTVLILKAETQTLFQSSIARN